MKQFLPRGAVQTLVVSLALFGQAQAQKSPDLKITKNNYGVPGSEERFELEAAIVREKLDTALLPAMRAYGIDMWIVLDRENRSTHLIVGFDGGGSVGVGGIG